MIGSWNVRGLNGFRSQQAVRKWISECSLGLVGLLETKVSEMNVDKVLKLISPS